MRISDCDTPTLLPMLPSTWLSSTLSGGVSASDDSSVLVSLFMHTDKQTLVRHTQLLCRAVHALQHRERVAQTLGRLVGLRLAAAAAPWRVRRCQQRLHRHTRTRATVLLHRHHIVIALITVSTHGHGVPFARPLARCRRGGVLRTTVTDSDVVGHKGITIVVVVTPEDGRNAGTVVEAVVVPVAHPPASQGSPSVTLANNAKQHKKKSTRMKRCPEITKRKKRKALSRCDDVLFLCR